jgi:hypothetical protein
MADPSQPTCRLVRPDETYDGKQGLTYFCGIAAETVGSKGICMHLLTIPPGGRAKAHMHASHETAIYVLEGEAVALYGDRLQHHAVTKAGTCSTSRPEYRISRSISPTSRHRPLSRAPTPTSRRASSCCPGSNATPTKPSPA